MNLLDFLILIPVVWGCIRGFSKGLIIELATLIGMVLGILAAYYFANDVSEILSEYFSFGTKMMKIISSALIFIAVMLLSWITGKIIEKVVDMIALGWLNKILGGLFGLVKGVLVSALIVMAIVYFDNNEKIITPRAKERSMFYQALSRVVPEYILSSAGSEKEKLISNQR